MAKERGRANGEGMIEKKKRKDGRWEGQYTVTLPDGTLKRKSVYAHTKKEVVAKLRKSIADRDGGFVFEAEDLTVAGYLERWLADSVKGSVAGSTFERYEQLSRLHQGELLGLKWSDLNLNEGTLAVKRSLRVDKSGPRFTEGKRDRSRRRIDLGASTVGALKAHRARQNEERLKYAGLWEDHGLVFCKEDGGPIRVYNMARNSFAKALKRAGLDGVGLTFHGLRHTCATLMLLNNCPAKVVSERLGHADVAFTLRVYSHVLPAMQSNAADGLDEMLF
jgi:hypothetical protein